MTRHKTIIAITSIIIALIVVGFVSSCSNATKSESITINNIEVKSITPLNNTNGLNVSLSIEFANTAPITLQLSNVMLKVMINNATVGTYNIPKLTIDGSSTKKITFNVSTIDRATAYTIFQGLENRNLKVKVIASVPSPVTWFNIIKVTSINRKLSTSGNVNITKLLHHEKAHPSNLLTADVVPASVYKVWWEANGHEVTEVEGGTKVTVHVVFDVNVYSPNKALAFYVCIKRDYKIFKDTTYKCVLGGIQADNPSGFRRSIFNVTFKAKDRWFLRGYYVVVYSTNQHYEKDKVIYTMRNSYPPRLKVN